MGGLKTLAGAVSCLVLAGGPLAATTVTRPDLTLFADCAGRFSALREVQWMFDGPASERSTAEMEHFAAMIEAVATGDEARAALHRRVAAKAAFRGLLAQVRFGRDPGGRAARRAEELIAGCRALVPGG